MQNIFSDPCIRIGSLYCDNDIKSNCIDDDMIVWIKNCYMKMESRDMMWSLQKFSYSSFFTLWKNTSYREKRRSKTYYGAKGLLRPKTGLVLPKFHSKHACSLLPHHKWNWRVYYRVTSLRKRRSEIYYSTKGLLRPKTGLVFPKFHSNLQLGTCFSVY